MAPQRRSERDLPQRAIAISVALAISALVGVEAHGATQDPSVCRGARPDDAAGCDFEAPDLEPEAEEEVLKVSLLQTNLKLGAAPRGEERLAVGAPAAEAPAALEIAASGAIDQVAAHRSAHSEAVGSPAREAAPEEDAEATVLLQTEIVAASAPPRPPAAARAWPPGCEGALRFAGLQLRSELGVLSALGSVPAAHAEAHEAGRAAGLAAAETWAAPRGASLLQDAAAVPAIAGISSRPSSSAEVSILALYMSFYVVSLFLLTLQLKTPPSMEKKAVGIPQSRSRHSFSTLDVEEEEYRRSAMGWLAVGWASAWVSRWGQSFSAALMKVKACELPQLGNKEWQAHESGDAFERLWAEEVASVGEEKATLWNVVPRLWTHRVLCNMLLVQAGRIFVTQLYVVILIEHALQYFHWLQGYVNTHGDLPSMVVPMLVTIVAFSSLPFYNVLFMSIASALGNRLDQQLLGGLAVALFKKAQRLPAASSGSGSGSSSGSTPSTPESGKEQEEAAPSANLDLMTLLNYDIAQQLYGCFEHICSFINSFVAFVILMAMLWMRLRVATLVVLACAIPTVMFSVARGAGLSLCMLDYQDKVDKRITALREVLFGIRVVKCYAWEDAMEERIGNLRAQEVTSLAKWYHNLGIMYGVVLCFPRLLVFAGLWGYSALYGHQDVVTIFTCMVILGSLRCMCEIFASSLSRIVTFLPTIHRVETYLKLPEAPLILPHKIPHWVKLQDIDGGVPESTSNAASQVALSLHGSYKWRLDGTTVLHDLALDVQRGELVAVLGEVGAGKSTFLHAVLGELFPADDGAPETLLARPREVAFCPQVAHIAEGTVQQNILFGQEFDEDRYSLALHCASLESDLKVIDGGDSALIGARGVALSGGQKARVAMARVAYRASASLVLLDDPFGAVDAPTAKFLLEELILGQMLEGRTRIVVMQPDAERLRRFDRIVVLERGRVKENGPPKEVMGTEAYQRLLSSTCASFEAAGPSPDSSPGAKVTAATKKKEDSKATVAVALREDEREGRPTWSMIKQYCKLGRWRNLMNFLLIFSMQTFMFLLCDLVLAHWTNAMSFDAMASDRPFLFGYFFWLVMALIVWFVGWNFGTWFTLRISGHIHNMALSRILRAPVDKFFDRHPVGRIMNRLHNDVVVIDTSLFLRFFGSFAVVVQTLIPMMYIHSIMPWFVSVAALPLYYLIASFVSRAWNTLVPMIYCIMTTKSFVAARAGDVSSSNVVLRGLQDSDRLSEEFADAFNDANTVDLIAKRVLKRWLVNRVTFMWSFYTVTTFLVGMLNAQYIGAGTLGLCLTNLLILEVLLEPNIENSTGALFEFICLARVHEYLSVPQERAALALDDGAYRSFASRVPRSALRALSLGPRHSSGAAEVLLDGARFLVPSADGTALTLAIPKGGPRLAALCAQCPKLAKAEGWHRIVAVNDAVGDADAIARELCGDGKDDKEQVLIDVRSGWLSDGALVEVQGLRAGYANLPRDVLKGIDVTFEKKSKVAIAGTTGCGKSSFLLVMLRILEPRAGRILLDGVDTRELGLATLRTALGLVPQDPVLFSGTIRQNLDPFGDYSDGRILQALECVRLADLLSSWSEGLDYQIKDEGGNLSFGQRQLVCLARMILRQPPLLLLDEATSAIDPYTQECVQRAIDAAFVNSTLLAVAHRLETVLKFDYALVLEKGEVAEHGRVSELREKRGGVLRTMLEAKSAW